MARKLVMQHEQRNLHYDPSNFVAKIVSSFKILHGTERVRG